MQTSSVMERHVKYNVVIKLKEEPPHYNSTLFANEFFKVNKGKIKYLKVTGADLLKVSNRYVTL
jgi:hypothetical protein